MINVSNPHDIHEKLIVLLVATLCVALLFVLRYFLALFPFFAELRAREPDVWVEIGSPTFANMIFMPYHNFRKFYAFRSVLKERSKPEHDYKYAKKASNMLKYGTIIMGVMFVEVFILIVWIETNGL